MSSWRGSRKRVETGVGLPPIADVSFESDAMERRRESMKKREVPMPVELIWEIAGIVHREGYTSLMGAFPAEGALLPICLDEDEAADLIVLAVIEVKKARLRFPYYDDEHPMYDKQHEMAFDDVQMGIFEKTVYYVGAAFQKGIFDHLLR